MTDVIPLRSFFALSEPSPPCHPHEAWPLTPGQASISPKWMMRASALMSGGQVLQSATLGAVGTNWQLFGQRDFDDNGRTDLLWRDGTTGTAAVWLMNGLQVAQSGALGAVPNNWSIVGVSNVGCGCEGILWRDANTGTLAQWLASGLTVTQTGSFGALPTNWSVVASDNIFLYFRDSSTGTLAAWLVFGFQVLETFNFGAVPGNWSVVGISDLDGNGVGDLLWRDANTGALAVWLMGLSGNALTISQTGSLGSVPTSWIVAETGDFNGDGYADILWRDTTTGAAAIWFMNGVTISSAVSLGVVPTSWTAQGTNAD